MLFTHQLCPKESSSATDQQLWQTISKEDSEKVKGGERYGCIAGYPNGTYRGNRAL